LWAFGVGDIEAITQALGDLEALGKRRNIGAGRVARVTVRPVANDVGPHFGLMLPSGEPARVIPVKVWQEIGGSDRPKSYERVGLPRWAADDELCVTPPAEIERAAVFQLMRSGHGD
jgi:hypothetical protein